MDSDMLLFYIVAYLLVLWVFVANCQTDGDVRLTGTDQRNGTLEIFHNGIWGTVCGSFSSTNAYVVCRQLGFDFRTTALYYISENRNGNIWLDGIACIGSENSISHCTHNGFGNHNCDHNDDVGVTCVNTIEGDLRLDGGDAYGRLEIFHNGVWGTVCTDAFDYMDALVACRQLYPEIKLPHNITYYTDGKGTGPIWLDDLYCRGEETSLMNCKHPGWGNVNCNHSEDVGIRCFNASYDFQIIQARDDIRLVDGGDTYGRLEVFYSGSWGTVCDDGFGNDDAEVVCRQLNLLPNQTYSGIYYTDYYTDGKGTGRIWLDDLGCLGNEGRLQDCPHQTWGFHNCNHREDVGVRCLNSSMIQMLSEASYGDLRLVDGFTQYDGRLEIYYDNKWGTICSTHFGIREAKTACTQLSYGTGEVSFYSHGNLNESQNIALDEVNCIFVEDRLDKCSLNLWQNRACNYNQTVGIRCYGQHGKIHYIE